MGRQEIEELCERKKLTIIPFDIAEKHLDSIPYSLFWVEGRDLDDENRPFFAYVEDGKLKISNCNEKFMINVVVLREERTIAVEIRDSLDNMKRAMEMSNNEKEAEKINDVIRILAVLKHGRKIKDGKHK